MTPREVIALCREREIRAVDLRFTDFPGTQKHFTIPVKALTEATFEDGLGFDASSLYGWQAINESDMLLVPVPETAFVDPLAAAPTLAMTCNIQDPITREDYAKDPRNVARKAANYARQTGIADEAMFGAEPEFFVFDDVAFDLSESEAFYRLDSIEGEWNRGAMMEQGPNRGYHIRRREGYFPMPPADTLRDVRSEMMLMLEECGVPVEAEHHEVATGGQCEIDLAYGPLVDVGDQLLRFKYVVKNVAARHGKTATFMPKPIWNDNGNGLHLHFSLRKNDESLFAGSGYGGLSETAMHAIGGILKHSWALAAFCCPTTNSYKRLVPGFDAPVNLTYSFRNRSVAVRIPVHGPDPRHKRIEFRLPDGAANGYLALSAILMAALDGIQNNIDPGPPLDKDVYDLSSAETTDVPPVPPTLDDALRALREDHDFLLRGDVFTADVIDTWIWFKQNRECAALRERPHPWEFAAYYDV